MPKVSTKRIQDFYSDWEFLGILTYKFGNNATREVWARTKSGPWELPMKPTHKPGLVLGRRDGLTF